MKLTNEEKETIITFDEASNEAIIFTYSTKWQRHLEKKVGLEIVFDNGYGGKEYRIAKKRIPMPRAPRRLSAKQRKELGQRLSKARAKKSPNSSQNHVITMKSEGGKVNEYNH